MVDLNKAETFGVIKFTPANFAYVGDKQYKFEHKDAVALLWAYMEQKILWDDFLKYILEYANWLKVVKPELFENEPINFAVPDAVYTSNAEPKTQKAKGIKYIANNPGPLSAIPYEILTGEDRDDEAVDKFIAKFSRVFARPCPEVPRHGFVDSRVVEGKEPIFDLFNEVRKVDPKGELVIMKPIEAVYNSVITPYSMTIGRGNDGATVGRNTLTFPLMGTWLKRYTGDLDKAGIAEGDVPYVETVSAKNTTTSDLHYIAQMRGGPKLESRAVDFVPVEVRVTSIIRAEGDLLEWEQKMKDAKDVVVDHVGGSLTSHYGVHAILNNIPVLTSRSPRMGEKLAVVNDTVSHDYVAVIAGLIDSLNSKFVKRKQGTNARRVAAMIYATQYFSALGGVTSYYIGYAVGTMLLFGAAACGGEYRHNDPKTESENRNDIYYKTSKNYLKTRVVLAKWARSFAIDDWSSGFGGLKWYDCAEAIIDLDKAARMFLREPNESSFKDMVMSMNRAVNCAHNGGWWFNKFVEEDVFDKINDENLREILNATTFLFRLKPRYLTAESISYYNKLAGAKAINPKVERTYKLVPKAAVCKLIVSGKKAADVTKEDVVRNQSVRFQIQYVTGMTEESVVYLKDVVDTWDWSYDKFLPSLMSGNIGYTPCTWEEVDNKWQFKLPNGLLINELPVRWGFSRKQFTPGGNNRDRS